MFSPEEKMMNVMETDLHTLKVTDPFLGQYQQLVRDVVIPYQWDALNDRIPDADPSHAIANFRIAAGLQEGEFYGMVFQDTDVAKWLETASYTLAYAPDEKLKARMDEVIRLVPAIRRHGLKVVAMTGNPSSTLAKLADVHLAVPCGKEACPFGMAPTNSTTATMAMGDALAMVMIDARRFDIKSYAANHPAGAIGRALVMKVTDVMRTGERLATVGPEATVLEALMKMTAAHGGSAAIVDADGKLLGIFTDGDFRRHVSEGRDILHEAVSTYMTKGPVFVHNDIYAAELLKVFERKQIDDLPVCDVDGRLVGLVDISDLPKMKVL